MRNNRALITHWVSSCNICHSLIESHNYRNPGKTTRSAFRPRSDTQCISKDHSAYKVVFGVLHFDNLACASLSKSSAVLWTSIIELTLPTDSLAEEA